MVSIQVLATPISGRLRSASVNPMALNMERAPARSRPSVIPRLMCLRSIVRDYRTSNADVKPQAPRPGGSLREPSPALSAVEGCPWWLSALFLDLTSPTKTGNLLSSRLPQLHDAAQEPSCLPSYSKIEPTPAPLRGTLPSSRPLEDAAQSTPSHAPHRRLTLMTSAIPYHSR